MMTAEFFGQYIYLYIILGNGYMDMFGDDGYYLLHGIRFYWRKKYINQIWRCIPIYYYYLSPAMRRMREKGEKRTHIIILYYTLWCVERCTIGCRGVCVTRGRRTPSAIWSLTSADTAAATTAATVFRSQRATRTTTNTTTSYFSSVSARAFTPKISSQSLQRYGTSVLLGI